MVWFGFDSDSGSTQSKWVIMGQIATAQAKVIEICSTHKFYRPLAFINAVKHIDFGYFSS